MAQQVMVKGLEIGIDFGTSNILVYVEGEGIIFDQPSVIAIDKATRKVVSIGIESQDLLGREHLNVEIVRPIDGQKINIDVTKEVIEFILLRIKNTINEPIAKLIISLPSIFSNEEKDIVQRHTLSLLEENSTTIIAKEVKAAAVGAGMNIYEANGKMIINFGGGTTDIGVLSLGDIVIAKSSAIAGEYIDRKIVELVKENHNLDIGIVTAEKIKLALITLKDFGDQEDEKVYHAAGRDVISNLPKEVVVTRREIKNLALKCFELLKTQIISVLEMTPPELSGDLCDNGIVITGGGALIPGIEEYIHEFVKIHISLSISPLSDVVNGTKKLLKINDSAYLGSMKY